MKTDDPENGVKELEYTPKYFPSFKLSDKGAIAPDSGPSEPPRPQLSIQKFRAAIKEREEYRRFHVDRYVEELPNLLRECYIAEVRKRPVPYSDDETTLRHIAAASQWLSQGRKPGLLLYGNVGSGKSTLARAIAVLIKTLYPPSFQDSRCLRSISALELSEAAKSDPDRFTRVKHSELLAIDDLGIEPSAVKVWGNELNPIVETLYYRYDRQLFTIVTSNLNSEDLRAKYGERVADRVAEMFDRVSFTNNSYRK